MAGQGRDDRRRRPGQPPLQRREADNFRYRVEAKINDKGNSGQYFRTKFEPGFPTGYEAQINATHGDPIRTGSLYPAAAQARTSTRRRSR